MFQILILEPFFTFDSSSIDIILSIFFNLQEVTVNVRSSVLVVSASQQEENIAICRLLCSYGMMEMKYDAPQTNNFNLNDGCN